MISCVLLSHTGNAAIVPLTARICELDPRNHVFIHTDEKASPFIKSAAELLSEQFENCRLIDSRNCTWGGFSLVAATIDGLAAATEHSSDGWAVVLSDTHLPIQPLDELQRYLDNASVDAIMLWRKTDLNSSDIHKGGRFKFAYFEAPGLGIMRGAKRPPRMSNMVIGSQWIALRLSLVRELLPVFRQETQWFKESFVPDESFFHNIILQRVSHERILNSSLTYQEWHTYGPAALDTAQPSSQKTAFFARKYHKIPPDFILSGIEEKLLGTLSTVSTQPCYENDSCFSTDNQNILEDIIIDYAAQNYGKSVFFTKAVTSTCLEEHVFFESEKTIFLSVRTTKNSTSLSVSAYQKSIQNIANSPLICPEEQRTPLIRFPSEITKVGVYPINHPALARFGNLPIGFTDLLVDASHLRGWIDIYYSILYGEITNG